MFREVRIIFFLCFISINGLVYSQITTNWTSDKQNGCTPVIVNFTDLSSSTNGPITKWDWDFGNGVTSDTSTPSVSYTNPGLYTIKLRVFDGQKWDSLIHVNYIEVFNPPTANFNGGPIKACMPHTVNFTDLSVIGSAPINSWSWDFGDGQISNTQNPTHIYTTAGTRTVSLIITDTNGCKAQVQFINYIQTHPLPEAIFGATSTYDCNIPSTFQFTNGSTGNNLSYKWDFGDGNSSTNATPQNTYQNFGAYTIKLVVVDANGCKDSLSRVNYISIAPYTGSFTPDRKRTCSNPGIPVKFNNTTFSFQGVNWNFGDGGISYLKDPSHTYTKKGTYPVYMVVSNGICSDTIRDTIYVQEITSEPVADSMYNCKAPFVVNLHNASTTTDSLEWIINDSIYSIDSAYKHTFTIDDHGLNQVVLKTTNDIGCIEYDTIEIFLDSLLPAFSLDYSSGCLPLVVRATDLSIASDQIVEWYWNFGNGEFDTGQVPDSTVYTKPGKYSYCLTVETLKGCFATSCLEVAVGDTPNIYNTWVDTGFFCVGDTVYFNLDTDSIGEKVYSYTPTESGSIPYFVYQDTGWIDVEFMVIWNGCRSEVIEKDSALYVGGPVLVLDYELKDCSDQSLFTFTDNSYSFHQQYWVFPNNDTVYGQYHDYDFVNPGLYNVKLVVENDSTGCIEEKEVSVRVYDTNYELLVSQDRSCDFLWNVDFELKGDTHSKFIYESIYWDFDNGKIVDTNSNENLFTPAPVHYLTPADYIPYVTFVNPYECPFTLRDTIIITENISAITIDSAIGCNPAKYYFKVDPTTNTTLVKWNWSFDNGMTDTVEKPLGQFSGTDSFFVYVITIDDNGCEDSATIKVNTYSPTANFVANKYAACIGEEILFASTSSGQIIKYEWFYGDGNTSLGIGAKNTYTTPGEYDVTLVVTDTSGCTDTMRKGAVIKILNSTVNFNSPDSISFCPPAFVNFKNLSFDTSSIISYNWSFGDGSSSTFHEPSHNYLFPGKYTVRLIIENAAGCIDTLEKIDYVEVLGPSGNYQVSEDTGCASHLVRFKILTSKFVNQVKWDMGNGNILNGDTVLYSYKDTGVFYPTMIINNGAPAPYFCEYGIPFTSPIVVGKTVAGFELDTNQACTPGILNLTDTSWGNQNLTIDYNFGNGNTSSASGQHQINYPDSGTYTITLITNNDMGCKDSFSQQIQIHLTPEITPPNDTIICPKDEVYLIAENKPELNYNWSPGAFVSDSTISNPLITAADDITYTLTVTSDKNCATVYGPISIDFRKDFTINAYEEKTIMLGGSTTLTGVTSPAQTNYVWAPNEKMVCPNPSNTPNCKSPTVSPIKTTEYTVTSTDEVGCFSHSAKVIIYVDDRFIVDFPDAFTPNGDGKNDIIYVKGLGIKELEEFSIFNRWGEKVYSSTDLEEGWDGYYHDVLQDMDTYAYYIRARSFAEEVVEKKGFIHLLR